MKRFIAPSLPVVAALAALGGCSNIPEITSVLTPYRMDVRQGNFVTKEMSMQLKPGQTKDQVRFILGTPLINDLFHGDRWDYVYRFQPGHGEPQQRRLVVYFVDGKLLRVDGDVIADESLAVKDKLLRTESEVIEIESAASEADAAAKDKIKSSDMEKNKEKEKEKEKVKIKVNALKLEPQMTMPGGK